MRRGLIIVTTVVVLAGLVAVSGSPAPATVVTTGQARSASGPAIDALESRFLVTRPTVGPTWVVDIGSTSDAERLMMRTLQGIVNRTSARMYVKDGGDAGANRWLDEYQARGLITVAGTLSVSGALDKFASEATGYVLATESEPWTFGVASTIAAADGGVVATPDLVAELQARGLTQIEDLRGKWTDAATAYEDTVATYRSKLPYKGIAVLREGDSLWDFAVQQGMLVVFTRPNAADWTRISALITGSTPGHAVYGYLSDTGDEEAIAVQALTAAGLFLVPTDTTRNLSFQVAVGADLTRQKMAAPDVSNVAPCTSDQVNVVVGITDGDNINVPLSHYSRPTSWTSGRRGEMPLGWSIGPSLAILAPSAWDTYAAQATPNDELLGMIGYAYAAPVVMPDATQFYEDSFALMDELGMKTFWSLGGGLEAPSSSGWSKLDAAAGTGIPDGVLVGYGNSSGKGSAFYSPAGRPAFTSGTAYADGPAQLADQVNALVATPAADRPLVSFLSASNWANPVSDLIDALKPLTAKGVRYLTPAQATACVPPAPVVPPPVATAGTCLPGDPIAQSGYPIISDPLAGEVKRVPTALSIPLTVSATPTVHPGGTIDYQLTTTVDLDAVAKRILEDRARPLIAGGYGQDLAATAWVQLDFDHLTLRVPLPADTAALGDPTSVSTGAGATARWGTDAGAPSVEIELDHLAIDTRTPGSPFDVTATWKATSSPDRPTPWTADVVAGHASFDLATTIGVLFVGAPLTGTASATWSCTPSPEVLATTAVVADPNATTTSTSTSSTSTSSTSTSPSSTSSLPPSTSTTTTTTPATTIGTTTLTTLLTVTSAAVAGATEAPPSGAVMPASAAAAVPGQATFTG